MDGPLEAAECFDGPNTPSTPNTPNPTVEDPMLLCNESVMSPFTLLTTADSVKPMSVLNIPTDWKGEATSTNNKEEEEEYLPPAEPLIEVEAESKSPSKRKRSNPFPKDLAPYFDPVLKKDIFTEAELQEVLWRIAGREFGGNETNSVTFVHKRWEVSDKKIEMYRRLLYCAYHNACNCGWRLAVHGQNGLCTIYIAVVPHVDHEKENKLKSLPKQLKTLITSPTTLQNQAPKTLMYSAMNKGVKLTKKDQQRTRVLYSRMFRNVQSKHLIWTGGGGLTWGNAVSTLESMKRQNIEVFDSHTVFLCGNTYICNSQTEHLAAAMSTENLLLNAHRQSQCGQGLFFAVDTSYRCTPEQTGLMPVKTVSLNQEGHTIACGVVSNENTDTHKFIFSMIKKEVEMIVNRLAQEGRTHV